MKFTETEEGFFLATEHENRDNNCALYEIDLNPYKCDSEVDLPQFDLTIRIFFYDQPQLGEGTRMQFIYYGMSFFPEIQKESSSILKFLNELHSGHSREILDEMIVEYIKKNPLQFFSHAAVDIMDLKSRISELEEKLVLIRNLTDN